MHKPKPKKNAECGRCLERKPLLIPVDFVPGWPIVIWEHLCFECRMQVQFSKHSDFYCEPGSIWKYSNNPESRAKYKKWLGVKTL